MGKEAHDLMPFQNGLTTIYTTGFVLVRDALPVRQKAGTAYYASPYSPPIRLLAEETSMNLFQSDDRPEVVLSKITLHEGQIASFTWETPKELTIIPGQAIILDCSPLFGSRQYQHMSPYNPTSVNDDHIRTWTVSSSSTGPTHGFTITLRHKIGGALTTAFFAIADKLLTFRKELLADTRPLDLKLKIAGVTGNFILPPPSLSPSRRRDFVWFAGGIGVTPFLSMLKSLRETVKDEEVTIHLIFSTREPDILLPLVFEAYSGIEIGPGLDIPPSPNPNIRMVIDVFDSKHDRVKEIDVPSGVVLRGHPQRVDVAFIEAQKTDLVGKEIYLCGPDIYSGIVSEALTNLGVAQDRIRTEDFIY